MDSHCVFDYILGWKTCITINTIMKMNLILFSQLQHSVPLVDLKTLDLIPLICLFFRFSDVKMKTAAHLSLASSVSVVEGHHRCGQQVECLKPWWRSAWPFVFLYKIFLSFPRVLEYHSASNISKLVPFLAISARIQDHSIAANSWKFKKYLT